VTHHELHAAIDTERRLPAARGGMLGVVAMLGRNVAVDDAAALGAMPHGSIATSMIHVLAQVGAPGEGHRVTWDRHVTPI
jgi:hypothetical protein